MILTHIDINVHQVESGDPIHYDFAVKVEHCVFQIHINSIWFPGKYKLPKA